ncbi:MAG: hypothetical protein DI565_14760 [Ancylobacter novellus]|uniref:Uncharacterized protein n=1 Tax=Ancylobacter novellus TaxID=921 RepID=A0A2W5K6Y7_ANCNO|nr:MAG: hypothetical protein DI565_14760 [Ancylobacter novellus]
MRILAAAVSLSLIPACASAQSAPAPRSGQGTCSKLVVAGQDATASCAGKVSTMTLPDGTLFVIFNAGRTMIGFSGRRADVASGAPWPVGFVNIGVPDREPNAIPATGACRFGGPTPGAGRTSCSAQTGQGRFEAEFAAAGRPAPR